MKLFDKLSDRRFHNTPRRARAGAGLGLVWALALTLGTTLGATLGLAGAAGATPATTPVQSAALDLTPLHTLGALDAQGDSSDGAAPVAPPLLGDDGLLYGVTSGGGTHGAGTVFKVKPDGTGYTVLRSLDPDADGASPLGALTFYGTNVLYGTASDRGPGGGGTVWTMHTDGTAFTVLHAFPDTAYLGGFPWAGLVSGGDGFFYGTTSGGASGGGMVYRIAPDGSGYSVLHLFYYGDAPLGPVAVRGGVLYGTTSAGGVGGLGSVFQVCTGGSGYAVLYSFTGGADGGQPWAGLTWGGDGFFYGTTSDDQLSSSGSVFKIKPDGSGFSTLYAFTGGSDGAEPLGGVSIGPDGKLYGTAAYGGASGAGTVFSVGADGTGFTTVSSLSGTGGDGGNPQCGLTLGTGGRWYGTCYEGGPGGTGALFALAPETPGTTHAPAALAPAAAGTTHAHVLWNNPNGSASVWDLSDPSPAATAHTFGPFPGWTAESLADGPNNIVSLLWGSADGGMCVWRIDSTGAYTSSPVYGPSNTWVARAVAVGADGLTRVLWNHSDGTALLWTLDAGGGLASSTPGYTPAAGWSATGLTVGADGLTRVLWQHTSGAGQVWTMDPAGPHTDTPVYGAGGGWAIYSIASDPDGLTRILWKNTDGSAAFWRVDAGGDILGTTPPYAAPAGGSLGGLAVGADGQVRLLWDEAAGSCQVWTLGQSNSYTASPVYSLPSGWAAAALAN